MYVYIYIYICMYTVYMYSNTTLAVHDVIQCVGVV